ncbi:aminopeptidase [bacterium]|nr:aminopeptidase [bacterium]
MHDARDRDLAKVLVGHSVKAKKGELVYIEAVGLDTAGLAQAIAEEVARVGAAPHIALVEPEHRRSFMINANEAVMKRLSDFELLQMKDAQCFIGIRGAQNIFEYSDVPRKQLSLYNKTIVQPVHMNQRVRHTRWCVLRYPNASMAQLSQSSRTAFAEFYYRVCTLDYAAMAKAVKPLRDLMAKTDRVTITGPGTNLEFSIKGIGVIPCTGTHNIPDGECFTAPVRDSINGTVQFNTPTVYEGAPFDNIQLTFEKGKVIKAVGASKDQTARLNKLLDQDEGARYVGEFAIAFNPFILQPMRDILFDEKIAGSFHMALGNAYDDADNGNRSSIHWDMVCIQRPDYGGGEIAFDGKVIRKDGQFVPKNLAGLNPEAFA